MVKINQNYFKMQRVFTKRLPWRLKLHFLNVNEALCVEAGH